VLNRLTLPGVQALKKIHGTAILAREPDASLYHIEDTDVSTHHVRQPRILAERHRCCNLAMNWCASLIGYIGL
jgi:hypothetical protein